MTLKEWQEINNFSTTQGAAFFGVSRSTYEKWLYQINPCPNHIIKLIEMDAKIKTGLEIKGFIIDNMDTIFDMTRIELIAFAEANGFTHPHEQDMLLRDLAGFAEIKSYLEAKNR